MGKFQFRIDAEIKNPDDKEKVIAKIEKLMFENRIVKWAKSEGITIEEWLKKMEAMI